MQRITFRKLTGSTRAHLKPRWAIQCLTGAGVLATVLLGSTFSGPVQAASANLPEKTYVMAPPAPERQRVEEALAKSEGCMTCHTQTDEHTMHANPGVVLGCTDCHGGNAEVTWNGPQNKVDSLAYDHTRAAREKGFNPEYRKALDEAHIQPRNEKFWQYPSSANPPRSYAKLNEEDPAYIRFINPGDLRIARDACG
ncbi:MAG: hypothetical protein R3194_12935, partial [Limnobacter sp.]|nr:hypothetical protein [Limnobacter sp.]